MDSAFTAVLPRFRATATSVLCFSYQSASAMASRLPPHGITPPGPDKAARLCTAGALADRCHCQTVLTRACAGFNRKVPLLIQWGHEGQWAAHPASASLAAGQRQSIRRVLPDGARRRIGRGVLLPTRALVGPGPRGG